MTASMEHDPPVSTPLKTDRVVSHIAELLQEEASGVQGRNFMSMLQSMNEEMAKSQQARHPLHLQRNMEAVLHGMDLKVRKACAENKPDIAVKTLLQERELLREYREEYQPLVKALGHAKAQKLFQARTGLLNRIDPAKWDLLIGLVSNDSTSSELYAEAMRDVLLPALNLVGATKVAAGSPKAGDKRKPPSDRNCSSPAAAGRSEGMQRRCIGCGDYSHWHIHCPHNNAGRGGEGRGRGRQEGRGGRGGNNRGRRGAYGSPVGRL